MRRMKFLESMNLSEDGDGIRVRVHVQPRARENAILGIQGNALKIRITSPPVGGAANRELRRFLADTLDIPISRIEILSGQTSRHKMVRITGVDGDRVRALLFPDS
jgi:uncharacterized protein (TIGR00251 family)